MTHLQQGRSRRRRAPPSVALEHRRLNGCLVFHSGCCGASALTRSRAKTTWKYIGCSAQSVPSLSNVAMRSATGTKSGEPSFVTFATNSTMDFLAAPSFQDRSGSAAWAMVAGNRHRPDEGDGHEMLCAGEFHDESVFAGV